MKKLLSMILITVILPIYAATGSEVCAPGSSKTDVKQSVKWYRDSAEKKALYNQAFSMGSQYVRNWVKTNHPKAKSWGVILDIDETVLDNSWYMFACGDSFLTEEDFSHYIANAKKSVTLPGAASFINLVHQLGGYVSLVSNRDGMFKDDSGSVMEATLENLNAQHIYYDQVVLTNRRDSKTPSDKNPRFLAIINSKYDSSQMVWSKPLPPHKVIAYFGDNIQDFPKLKQETVNALDGNDETFKHFGNGYFILPNPIYGSWQKNEYR